ncbi:MAG: hypothetical protein Q7S66_05015 [bacterium]|nr:hypothetical protein [bacterium]
MDNKFSKPRFIISCILVIFFWAFVIGSASYRLIAGLPYFHYLWDTKMHVIDNVFWGIYMPIMAVSLVYTLHRQYKKTVK